MQMIVDILGLLLFLLVCTECVLIICVVISKQYCPWIITPSDEFPRFEHKAVIKFMEHSHDPELGWIRRPGTDGKESGRNGVTTFSIDANGSRANPSTNPATIATFGDSFVFCRQVSDTETWQVHLSKALNTGVLNFGVGNYGLDQALLRYERTTLPSSVTDIIVGFVPETICRIQSRWKHYLEFGNILAFKPVFELNTKNELVLVPNPVRSLDDFNRIMEVISNIRKKDRFYAEKFKEFQLRFPYTYTLLKHFNRNLILLSSAFFTVLYDFKLIKDSKWKDVAFSTIIKKNLEYSHFLYEDCYSRALLASILRRFERVARERGHRLHILVFPQLLDLKLRTSNKKYREYYAELSESLPVHDLTAQIDSASNLDSLYVNDRYGGHFSNSGNLVVATYVQKNIFSVGQRFLLPGGVY